MRSRCKRPWQTRRAIHSCLPILLEKEVQRWMPWQSQSPARLLMRRLSSKEKEMHSRSLTQNQNLRRTQSPRQTQLLLEKPRGCSKARPSQKPRQMVSLCPKTKASSRRTRILRRKPSPTTKAESSAMARQIQMPQGRPSKPLRLTQSPRPMCLR